jgi:hypothetical protein
MGSYLLASVKCQTAVKDRDGIAKYGVLLGATANYYEAG